MKINGYILFANLFLCSCASGPRSIIVENTTAKNRIAEMVEVKVSALKAGFEKKTYVLKNADQKEIPYQLVYGENKKPQTLIFQASVNANSFSTFTLSEGKPSAVEPKTSARFVPERKDDFAWENDLAAYRMYGPALANENPSNGVDIWLKRTSQLVVDKRYRDELQNGITYHVDHGDGLDCYKVGHTLGAGGIAPYVDDKLWIGNHYDSYKVFENGPLRSTFELTYDSVIVGKNTYKQIIRISTDAGKMLNKAVVSYEGAKQTMKLAGGIFLHDGKGSLKVTPEKGFVAYAENAVSDAGVPSGRNYIGVFIPDKKTESTKDSSHILLSADYTVGDEFTYYFGGGWSKWGYANDNEWFKAMETFTESVKNPLKVSVK